jgi:predicted lipoprotein with Yx(FWY)xxD motif
MNLKKTLIGSVFCAGLALTPAFALDMPDGIEAADSQIGQVLVDAVGMTLYEFDEDPKGASACYGTCATNWPPAKCEDAPVGEFGVITRDDGEKQWTYKGKPLYTFSRDKEPGDTTGDGVRGWHAARP